MPTSTPSFLEIRHMFAQIFAKLFVIKIQINYYFCLCRGAAVTTGLAFAQRFVGYAAVNLLITYFTKSYNLLDAVGLVNLLEGSSSFLVLVMTYISENHVSPLKVIVCSTAAYILGMVMFCFSYYYPIPDDKIGMYFVPAVLLISVGKAGGLPILEEFLVGQLTAHEPRMDKDEGRVTARKTVWWTASYLSAFLPPLVFAYATTWFAVLISSTSMMGICYLLFLGCIPFYHRSVDEATTTERASPKENISVDEATTTERASPKENISVDEATTTEIPRASPEENISVDAATTTDISGASPEENISMDEAITIEISDASPEENINNGLAVLAISLVKQWNPLSVMIPMWTTFLVFGLVLSAGDTFFIDQGYSLDSTGSMYILLMIRNTISSTPSFIFRLIRSSTAFRLMRSSTLSTFRAKCIRNLLKPQGIIIAIFTAMMVSIFCCSVAWRVEVHRLHAIPKFEMCVIKDKDAVIPMSIMWLAPQFCLLALMEGIGKQGLDLFFEVQVSDGPMKKYGSILNEAVIGFGSFLNGLLVFLFRSWFNDTLNCSRLDKYFQMLTVVSFVNLCYYWCVSTFYSNKKETKDDVEVEETGELNIVLVV